MLAYCGRLPFADSGSGVCGSWVVGSVPSTTSMARQASKAWAAWAAPAPAPVVCVAAHLRPPPPDDTRKETLCSPGRLSVFVWCL